MHGLHTDHGTGGLTPSGGHHGEGMGLRSAEAAVGAHELLERSHLAGVRVIHAVDEYVRAVREAVVAAQMIGRRGVKAGEGVISLDGVV